MTEPVVRQRAGTRDASRATVVEASRKDKGRGGGRIGPLPRLRNASRQPAPEASRNTIVTTGSGDTSRVGFVCPPCGRFIPTEIDGVAWRTRSGSPSRFCSPGCRQAAYRRRRAGVGEGVALQPTGGRRRSLAGRDQL